MAAPNIRMLLIVVVELQYRYFYLYQRTEAFSLIYLYFAKGIIADYFLKLYSCPLSLFFII
ncbi:hypothetical protein BpHYR1_009302 [Brachionus plicatilis]|uniref:Uncharacterized protein n=1 Tax=Brachionus plicatilis TaxID=10195 RepID=A0A3M7S7I4_BRAPC|nr:hypothetical protein BpHYR1_009302 [Brachionus plicatilis]